MATPSPELQAAIVREAANLGVSPLELATVISYETAGTFDPWKAGPTTQWGQHRGLIQWGEPQAREYGVSANSSVDEQMAAVTRYLRDRGVRPGMGINDIYSAINAGSVGRPNASDSHHTGRPNTVTTHVNRMVAEHQPGLAGLFDGSQNGANIGLPAAALAYQGQQSPIPDPTPAQVQANAGQVATAGTTATESQSNQARRAAGGKPIIEDVQSNMASRRQGGMPILERIRQRIRESNPDRATPFLDGIIENSKTRANVSGGQPILNWMREQRQNAGYETPFLNSMIRDPDPPMAPPVNKAPYTPQSPQPTMLPGTPTAPPQGSAVPYGAGMAQQPQQPAQYGDNMFQRPTPYIPPGPSTPATGVPYMGPQQSMLGQLGGVAARPQVQAPPTMQTTLSDMAARDLFSVPGIY